MSLKMNQKELMIINSMERFALVLVVETETVFLDACMDVGLNFSMKY
jgi:hypothetical protein